MWLSTRRIASSEPVSVIPNASWLEYTNDTILSVKLSSGEMVHSISCLILVKTPSLYIQSLTTTTTTTTTPNDEEEKLIRDGILAWFRHNV